MPPNFWVGEEVTILIWKRENWRGGGNFQTIAAHTILKVIGPRFFQEGKDQEEEGGVEEEATAHQTQKFLKGCASATPSLSSRPYCRFRNRLLQLLLRHQACQKSGETQALYQFCIKLPVFPLISGFLLSSSKEKTDRQETFAKCP